MPVRFISTEVLINHLRDTLSNPDNKICFILGAGASFESGIDTGAILARKWYNELPTYHSAKRIAEWKAKEDFDENNIPAFYSKLFRLRYEGHRDDGIHYITSIIEKGSPGFGYTILSQLLQHTPHNVVITTNFDTLTEESLYVFTNKRPLVCNHENLAHLIRPSKTRPLIVKIHRSLYMDPLNDQDETDEIKPQWETALSDIFHNYIPIVIGYGGNDGSLMNYLKNIDTCQRLYWCLNNQLNPRSDIVKIVNHHRGSFVYTGGFNRFMFRFIDLFGLTKMHEVLEQLAKVRAEKLRKEFEDAGKGIGLTGTVEEKRELGKVADDFDTSDWLQWQLKAETIIDPEEKYKIYMNAIDALPQSHQMQYSLGCWLIGRKRYDEAINAFNRAVEIKPDYHDAWFKIGITFYYKDEYEEAETAFHKAIKIKSDNYETWFKLGITYIELNKNDDAITSLQKAIEIKPDYHKAWYNLGIAYNNKLKFDDAIIALQKSINLKPDYYNAWNNLGISFTNKYKYDDAIHAFQKAVEIKPDYHEAWYNLGCLFERTTEFKNARDCFKKASILNPDDTQYKKAFGRLGKI